MQATVVVGNPKLDSRTRAAGVAVAAAVLPAADIDVIELGALSGALLTWGDEGVRAAKKAVLASDLVVVASPVYKASFTGLLKAFLDQFDRDELGAIATVPLMVGASPAHSLAVETHLRPVLVEIGASCPTRGVYLLEGAVAELDLTAGSPSGVTPCARSFKHRAPRPEVADVLGGGEGDVVTEVSEDDASVRQLHRAQPQGCGELGGEQPRGLQRNLPDLRRQNGGRAVPRDQPGRGTPGPGTRTMRYPAAVRVRRSSRPPRPVTSPFSARPL